MYKEAIEDYSAVIKVDRELNGAESNRPRQAETDGNLEIASNTHAFHNRGISHDKNGDYESAIADFTTVLELDSSNASAFFNRGSTHDAAGRTHLAIRDYTAAMALDESKSAKGKVSAVGF